MFLSLNIMKEVSPVSDYLQATMHLYPVFLPWLQHLLSGFARSLLSIDETVNHGAEDVVMRLFVLHV